jgi:hypothetical protein
MPSGDARWWLWWWLLPQAAASGFPSVCNWLIARGEVDVNALCDGSTALHMACSAGHLAVVQCLVKAGAVTSMMDRYRRRAEDVAKSAGLPCVPSCMAWPRTWRAAELALEPPSLLSLPLALLLLLQHSFRLVVCGCLSYANRAAPT